MPTIFIFAAATMGLVLVVLAVVVVGIRLEPSSQELTGQPPSPIAKFARRLLGVYVRRPVPSVTRDQQRGQPSHAAHGPRSPSDGRARLPVVGLPRLPGLASLAHAERV